MQPYHPNPNEFYAILRYAHDLISYASSREKFIKYKHLIEEARNELKNTEDSAFSVNFRPEGPISDKARDLLKNLRKLSYYLRLDGSAVKEFIPAGGFEVSGDERESRKPISLKVGTTNENGQIKLDWPKSYAKSYYLIEYAEYTDSLHREWKTVGQTPQSIFRIANLSPRTPYWFRISRINIPSEAA